MTTATLLRAVVRRVLRGKEPAPSLRIELIRAHYVQAAPDDALAWMGREAARLLAEHHDDAAAALEAVERRERARVDAFEAWKEESLDRVNASILRIRRVA